MLDKLRKNCVCMLFWATAFVVLQMPVTVWADEGWEKHWENKGVWWLGDQDKDQVNVEGVRLGASNRQIVAEFYQDWARLNVDTWINGNLTVYSPYGINASTINTGNITSIANIMIEADNDAQQPGSENITLRASGTNAMTITSTATTINNTLNAGTINATTLNVDGIGVDTLDANNLQSSGNLAIWAGRSDSGSVGDLILRRNDGGAGVYDSYLRLNNDAIVMGVNGSDSGTHALNITTSGVAINAYNASGLSTTIGNTNASAGSTTIQAGANSRVVTGTSSTELRGGANSASDGRISLSNNSATLGVTNGSSLAATNTAISAKTAVGYGLTVNNTGSLSLLGTQAGGVDAGLTISADGQSISLLNNLHGGKGLTVTGTTTTLTGGTNSSTWTLADDYARLGVGTATTPEVYVFQATNNGTTTGISIGSNVPDSSVTINTANVGGTTTTIGSTNASAGSVTTQAGNASMVVSTTGVNINTNDVAGLATTIGSTNASAGTVTIQSNTNSLTVNNTSTQLASTGATLGTSNNTISGNANGATLSMSGDNVSLTNSTSHGLTVTAAGTTLSGGTNSSVWSLYDGDDGGATLTVSGSGGGTTHPLFQATTDATGTTSAVTIGTAGNTVNTIQGLTNNLNATGTGSSNNIRGTTNINTDTAAGTLTTIGNTSNTVSQQSLQVNGAMSSTGNATIATANNTTNTFGSGSGATNTIGGGANSVNTIGNAGTSVNTITGQTNAITGTTSSIMTGSNATVSLSNNSATMSVTGGSNISATNNQVSALTASGQGLTVNNNGSLSLYGVTSGANPSGLAIDSSGNTVTLYNSVAGQPAHGLTIGPTSTTLTGGTNSSSLTLQDSAATLAVGTAATPEIQVLQATNTAGTTTVTIGGANNGSNQLLANATGGTNTITADADNTMTATNGQNTIVATNNTNMDANFINAVAGGNTITGQLGNVMNAITGANTFNANSISGANTLNANGDNGINTISATAATGTNVMTAGSQNSVLSAGTTADANLIDATGTGGGNTIRANTAGGSNNLIAIGTNGVNNIMANASTGTNNIEAKYNNIGVATTDSINVIGNTAEGTTVDLRGGNSYVSVADGQASIRSGSGLTASGLTTTSEINTLGTDADTLNIQLNGVGDDISRANLAGASYYNRLEGNTLINGNTYINGRLVYTSNTVAMTSVSSGESILSEDGTTTALLSMVNLGETAHHTEIDHKGRIVMTNGEANEATVSLTLTNGLDNTHGMAITERKTVISGGTRSTSLTLNDWGATFSRASDGAPVRVTGVDDGKSRWDAVNYGQLSRAVAMAGSLSSIPQVDESKTFSLGAGTSYYGQEVGIAVGGSARLFSNTVIKASASFCPNKMSDPMVSAGFAFSW